MAKHTSPRRGFAHPVDWLYGRSGGKENDVKMIVLVQNRLQQMLAARSWAWEVLGVGLPDTSPFSVRGA
jgi:hypothetical protein